jgi:nucleotide-binding universal stress UspA family protein
VLKRDVQGVAQAQRQWKKILVPAVDRPYSGRCLEVAYRLAQDAGATVQLAYVLEVPRALALEAALPEFEMNAGEALRVAQQRAVPFKVAVEPYVHRTRSAREGILRLVTQEKIDLLVLGGRPDGNRGLSSDLARDLFQCCPCETVVDYIAGEK